MMFFVYGILGWTDFNLESVAASFFGSMGSHRRRRLVWDELP